MCVCVFVRDKRRAAEPEKEEEIKREIGIREREEMRGWRGRRRRGGRQ